MIVADTTAWADPLGRTGSGAGARRTRLEVVSPDAL